MFDDDITSYSYTMQEYCTEGRLIAGGGCNGPFEKEFDPLQVQVCFHCMFITLKADKQVANFIITI